MRTSIVGKAAHAIGRAARLTLRAPGEAGLSARLALWVVLVSVLARLMPLPRAHRIVSTRVRTAHPAIPADAGAQLARAIDRVLRLDLLMFKRSCWRRALVLHRFLALRGIDSRVDFGVKTSGGELQGHAWLERNGQPFLEDDAASYVVTFSLPQRDASLRPHDDRETSLLLHCGRAAVDPERAAQVRALVDAGVDWDRVTALAARHGLRALLHRHLARICPELVPSAVLAGLRDYVQKNSAFGVLFTGELLRLLALLDDHGVEAMPFKGPALAHSLYGHVALRQFCDLDIMVRERDVWRASELLEADGFVADLAVPVERRDTFVRQDYVRLFRRDGGRTVVELHWAIAPRSFAVRFDGDAVWQRVTQMPLQGRTVRMTADEDLLLMLCVHGSRHSWDKLEGLAAVGEILRRNPSLDWPAVWRRAEAMHCRRMVAFGVLLASGLFDAPLPAESEALWRSTLIRSMARSIVRDAAAIDAPAPSFARQTAFYLRLKDSYTDRARAFARELTTPTPDDWALVNLPGPLAVAYPLVRALRVARKHGSTLHPAAGGGQ